MNGRIKNTGADPRLPYPIIGKIHVGIKDEGGFPRSIDWFRADGKYASLFTQAYGEKPSTIQIIFPSDDAELVCREEYEFRDTAGKLVAKGDGEVFKVWSQKSGEYVRVSTEETPEVMNIIAQRYPKCEWKVTLTMNFIIPMIRGVMGLWQFVTKGAASTIPQVRDCFDAMKESNGKVAGVIFDLSVAMAKSNKPNDKSRYPVVSLIANESRQNLEMVRESRKPILLE